MKKVKQVLSLALALIMVLTISLVPASAASKTLKGSNYRTVFVHGMMGWGEDDGLSNLVDYWGLASGSQMDYLKSQGYDVCEASVGSLSSAWDRACELYAQLTGTRVDYGVYHSKKYGHDRYGRNYAGKSILNYKWSSSKKVNLVGHSFGGATIRYLADLMKDGDQTEVKVAKAAGTSCSKLFTGGKGDWIYSITTLSSPQNGTTYCDVMPLLTQGSVQVYLLWAKALFSSDLTNQILDFQLDQFGIRQKSGEDALAAFLRIMTQTDFLEHNDNCITDFTVDKACAMNKRLDQNSNIFYFSYTGFSTYQESLTGAWLPDLHTFAPLMPFAVAMGSYTGYTDGSYKDGYGSYSKSVSVKKQYLGTEWQENDGFTNVYGNQVPYRLNSSGQKVFDKSIRASDTTKSYKPGYWYVMPGVNMDHFGVIGGVFTENSSDVNALYKKIMKNINSCTRKA